MARIKTVAAANRYLRERFVPDYNTRFTVSAAEPGSAFVPYTGRPLSDVLCVQEDRVVGADNCVSFARRSLQIRFRHRAAAGTMSAPPCGSTNISTSPSSTVPVASPVSTERENPDMPSRKPPESARRPRGLWVMDNAKARCPQARQAQQQQAADI
jgi:hypothetical protein